MLWRLEACRERCSKEQEQCKVHRTFIQDVANVLDWLDSLARYMDATDDKAASAALAS